MTRLYLFVPVLVIACSSFAGDGATAPVTNTAPPSAKMVGPRACPTKQTGDRPGYHSGAGPWIRDCNAPLEREYYRVFTQTTGKTTTAYLLPRPDGSPALVALCARKDMRTTLDRYGWCQTVAQPDRVNNMTVDDALAIAHRLHQDLKFVGGAGGVTPYPMPDDVAIVCAHPRTNPDLGNACVAYSPRDNDLAMIPSAKSAIAMAAALNKLYGIR